MAIIPVKGTFPFGATVVGVIYLIVAIYLMILSSAVIALRYIFLEEYCGVLLERDSSQLTDAQKTAAEACRYIDIVVYVFIGILVYGFFRLTFSAMLLSGINKNSSCLMLPFVVWNSLQILSLFIASIAYAVTLPVAAMVALIIGVICILVVPFYETLVVIRHQNETRKLVAFEAAAHSPVVQMYPTGGIENVEKDKKTDLSPHRGSISRSNSEAPFFSRRNSELPTVADY